jgi:hypothetical protein
MQRTTTVSTHVVCVLLLVGSVLVAMSAGAAATASQPDTSEEYLDALREYEGSEALATYSEMELMRSQAVTDVQTGEFADADAAQMDEILRTLAAFEQAYQTANEGAPIDSLTGANETRQAIQQLDTVGGSEYATLAQLGLQRFYRVQGETLYEQAQAAENTRVQLRYLDAAMTALRVGGASDRYSVVSAEASRLEATFEEDQARMNESFSVAATFLEECNNACSNPLTAMTTYSTGVYDQYRDARTAAGRAGTAQQLAIRHGLTDQVEQATQTSAAVNQSLLGLTLASTLLSLLWALVIAAPAAVVGWRLGQWELDRKDAGVGRIIPNDSVEVSDS